MLHTPVDNGVTVKPRTADSRVAVLLGTCNGAEFLGEQLHSIERQSGTCWELLASDDVQTHSKMSDSKKVSSMIWISPFATKNLIEHKVRVEIERFDAHVTAYQVSTMI